MHRANIFVLALLILSASCSTYRPIVDMQGEDQGRYETDLRECQAYVSQVSPATTALVGGAVGSGVGAILGLIVGSYFGQAG
jgi:outer membrane lipoprotein SlyB